MRNSKSSEVMAHHSVDDIRIAGTILCIVDCLCEGSGFTNESIQIRLLSFIRWTDTSVLQLQHISSNNIRKTSKGQKAMHASWLYRKREICLQ